MFENIENLKLLSSYKGSAKDYIKVNEKKHHSFIFRTEGVGVYNINGKSIKIHEGELAFLPKGSSYEFRRISEKKCKYMSIVFEADIQNPQLTIFNLENFNDKNYMLGHFVNFFNCKAPDKKFKCYSLFYALLSHLSLIEHPNYATKSKMYLIKTALDHLNDHIFDKNLKIEDLADMCKISTTYFRTIFISNFGVTPKEYVVNTRITRAKEILDGESGNTISEVSSLVGYSDPLYFSRAFKKKYGVPPTKNSDSI